MDMGKIIKMYLLYIYFMKLNKAYFLCHNGLGDIFTMMGAINFLLNYFEEIYFLCKNNLEENVRLLFQNKPIIIILYEEYDEREHTKRILKDVYNSDNSVNIFVSGYCHTNHIKSNINHPELLNYKLTDNRYIVNYDHIVSFYEVIGLNNNIYVDYFDIDSSELSVYYYNMIKDYDIIFFHTQSSGRKINLNRIVNQYINDDKKIIICANENIYPNNHNFYEIANKFINLKIIYYIDIIKNATEIYCIDSCFSCIVLPLNLGKKLNANIVKIISRDDMSGEYMELSLPVSLGEAIDKLTILDIKCDKIQDNRRKNVQNEYNILFEKLKDFIEKYNELYNSMKKINIIIWKQMDDLRDNATFDENYMKLCKECIDSNDIRFRIKNKINLISNSLLKEEKGYKINRLLIELNCNEESINLLIEPIKYFSYIYDEIIVNSSKNIDLIKEKFYYDNTIKYNIELTELEFKQTYSFQNNNYLLNEIYEIMNINKKIFNILS
jgi:hypothetical protein